MKLRKEYLFVAVSILCWGTSATVAKLILQELDAEVTAAFSFAFASLFLLAAMIWNGDIKKLKGLSVHTFGKMTVLGILGVLFYNVFILKGIAILHAQQAFVINYLWPACIIIFSAIILREKMNIGKIVAVVCSFLGVMVVTTNGNFAQLLSVDMEGVTYCVLAAVCYGLYSTLSKKETYNKNIATFVAYVTSTIGIFLYLAVTGNLIIPSADAFGGLAVNGILCEGIPYLMWILALDLGNTAVIANLAYLTPFVSLIMTHLVLGEKVTVFSVLGLFLIIGGILVQIITQKNSEKKGA